MPHLAPDAPPGVGTSRIPAELEAFFEIAEKWKLSTDEQLTLLGSPGRSTYFKWKKDGGVVPKDTLERISHMLGIYKCLQILFTTAERSDEWVKRPNEFFDHKSALDVMLGGSVVDIYRIRQYLDAQRGG